MASEEMTPFQTRQLDVPGLAKDNPIVIDVDCECDSPVKTPSRADYYR